MKINLDEEENAPRGLVIGTIICVVFWAMVIGTILVVLFK